MTKEKLVKLSKYLEDLKSCLSAATPKKHVGHADSYRAFLNKEIRDTQAKIEAAKLENTTK